MYFAPSACANPRSLSISPTMTRCAARELAALINSSPGRGLAQKQPTGNAGCGQVDLGHGQAEEPDRPRERRSVNISRCCLA